MIDPYDLSDEELDAAIRDIRAGTNSEDATAATENTTEGTNSTEEAEAVTTEEDNLDGSSEATTDPEESEEETDSEEGESDKSGDNDEADSETNPEEKPVKPTKSAKEKTTDAVTTEPHKFKANGKEYEITDEEMKQQFPKIFGQAMDYTRKMQQIKPWRKTIDALEHAKLKHEDINLMIDVFKGDKNAIAEVLKRTGVDAIDINTEEVSYKRNDYGRDVATLDLNDVLESISGDSKYAVTHSILSKEWDDASFAELSSDPEKVRLLHTDVMSGVYDMLLPDMQLAKVADRGRKSDLDYYMEAAVKFKAKHAAAEANASIRARQEALDAQEQELAEKTRIAKVQSDTRKRTEDQAAAARRKSAGTTGRAAGKSGAKDYLQNIDEDFDEWYKKLEER